MQHGAWQRSITALTPEPGPWDHPIHQTHRTAGLRTDSAFQLGGADPDYRHAESGKTFCSNLCSLYAPPPLMSMRTLQGHLSIGSLPYNLLVFRWSKCVQMASPIIDLIFSCHVKGEDPCNNGCSFEPAVMVSTCVGYVRRSSMHASICAFSSGGNT